MNGGTFFLEGMKWNGFFSGTPLGSKETFQISKVFDEFITIDMNGFTVVFG